MTTVGKMFLDTVPSWLTVQDLPNVDDTYVTRLSKQKSWLRCQSDGACKNLKDVTIEQLALLVSGSIGKWSVAAGSMNNWNSHYNPLGPMGRQE